MPQNTKFLVLLFCLFSASLFAQKTDKDKPIFYKVGEATNNKALQEFTLFSTAATSLKKAGINPSTLQKGTLLDLNTAVISKLQTKQLESLSLSLPLPEQSNVKVNLVRSKVLAPDFILTQSSSPGQEINYKEGLHFNGIVENDPNSLVSISIFDDEIIGMIHVKSGNYVIGKVEGSSNKQHLVYKDTDLTNPITLDCGTEDDGFVYEQDQLTYTVNRSPGDCIRVYIEIDDDIVTNKGGVAGATNYVTGVMNEVITLYANDNIAMVISEIKAWDTPAPYSGSSSSAMLSSYQSNTGTFNGDLSHLVSYQASGGIAAGFSGICNSNVDNSKCFSSIGSTYNNVPTYSFTVMVMTHEMGHLIGSRHTHACVWNGNGTAIDGCAGFTEGSCTQPGSPSSGGTIMSYCHLTTGIDFTQGFGPQPQAVLLNTINNATCLSNCGPATCTDGFQNGNETGIDCGGPDCPACPTCTDGILNGNETDIDCGGPDCPACPCNDNNITVTINLDNYPEETTWTIVDGNGSTVASGGPYGNQPDGSTVTTLLCLADGCYDFTIFDSYGDGICCGYGNGSYTVTDDMGNTYASGGAFASSELTNICISGGGPTCTDGVQNGNETDVDCGGPDCPACPTCTDGVQNGNETDVDCGGPDCPACPTCTDETQNGQETGVDCGGPDCPPCAGVCTYVNISSSDFDSGWGPWNDGGSDCRRSANDSPYAASGTYCIRLRDNSNSSVLTSDNFNFRNFEELTISFSYIARSMENGEDFWLQFSTNGGSTFTTIGSWVSGIDFQNGVRENVSAVATGPFTTSTRIRFRNDASANNDWIYIDDVVIDGCTLVTNLTEQVATVQKADDSNETPELSTPIKVEQASISGFTLFPNPTSDILNVSFDLEQKGNVELMVTDFTGKVIQLQKMDGFIGTQQTTVDASTWNSGFYFIHLIADGKVNTKKFVVTK